MVAAIVAALLSPVASALAAAGGFAPVVLCIAPNGTSCITLGYDHNHAGGDGHEHADSARPNNAAAATTCTHSHASGHHPHTHIEACEEESAEAPPTASHGCHDIQLSLDSVAPLAPGSDGDTSPSFDTTDSRFALDTRDRHPIVAGGLASQISPRGPPSCPTQTRLATLCVSRR